MISSRSIILLSILSFCLLSAVHSSSSSDFTTLPINKDSEGNYFVNVSWNSNTKKTNLQTAKVAESQDQENGKMALNLYSSESFVAACDSFNSYPKIQYDGKLQGKQMKETTLLYKESITGYSIPLTVNTPAFILANFPALHAVKCDSSLKHNIHGHLGLGSGSNSMLNALPSFSVFLSNGHDHFESKLFVGAQESLAQKYGDRSFHFSADTQDNWMMNLKDVKVSSKSLELQGSFSVMFDLNTEFIGVPSQIYNAIVDSLKENGVTCTEESGCQCQNIEKLVLPSFDLFVEGNKTSNNRIPITYFNKDTCSLLVQNSASKVNEAFDNAVILGAPFMRDYFVQFQQGRGTTQGHVNILKAKHVKSLDKHYYFMIGGVVLVAFALIVGIAIGLNALKSGGPFAKKEETESFLGNIQGEDSDFKITPYEEKEPVSGGLKVTTN